MKLSILLLTIIANLGCSIADPSTGVWRARNFGDRSERRMKNLKTPQNCLHGKSEDATYVKYHHDAKTNQLTPTFTLPSHSPIKKLKSIPKKDPQSHRSSCELEKKEYVLITNENGSVIILDAHSYEQVINFTLPEIAETLVAVIGDVLYNIDTRNGLILSTNVENLMAGQTDINWKHVGSFPKDITYIRNSVISHGSYIYFVTYNGNFYKYDTESKTVTKISGNIQEWKPYVSLAVVNDIVYIHSYMSFYSFDGIAVKELKTTKSKFNPGIFALGNSVCLVGGTDSADADPVECYDPANQSWTVPTSVNVGRQNPAIAKTSSGVHIFGGYLNDGNNGIWISSHEKMSYETRTWSYIPNTINAKLVYPQAVTFRF